MKTNPDDHDAHRSIASYISSMSRLSAAEEVGHRIMHIVEEASSRDGLDLADDITENLVDIATLCDMLVLAVTT